MKNFNAEDYVIFSAVTGSRLYGTATPESDYDTRGVCLPPLDILLHPFENFKVADSFDGEDKAIYNLRDFMKLCADANPNIVELLFIPDSHTLSTSWQWDKILENRDLFLSKNIRHRFLGYAFSQLDAIKRHREWFINPPDHKPTREEFGLTQSPLVSEGNLQNVLNVSQDLFIYEYREELNRERNYRDAKKHWDNYYQWRTKRNPKRKGTEEKYGYDTKYASHLFRLMTEGKELLLTSKITFPLWNAEELLAIKNGLYSYEKILELAAGMEQAFDVYYEESSLPHTPNRNALADLYYNIVLEENFPKNNIYI